MSMDERDAKTERDPKAEIDSAISEIWKAAAHPEPPAELDSRILTAARQAVSRPAPRRQGWWRLALPFSATAVLVLAVTLLLRVEREAPDRLYDAAPPATQEMSAPAEGDIQARQPPARAAVEAAEARPEPKRAAAPPRQAASKADVPAPAGASSEAGARPQAGGAELGEADRLQVPVIQPGPLLRQQAAPAASMELGKAKEEGRDGPSQAVEQIRRLLAAGRREEALVALAELRRRHPDIELPPDLQALR
jgi:hypothetical protein